VQAKIPYRFSHSSCNGTAIISNQALDFFQRDRKCSAYRENQTIKNSWSCSCCYQSVILQNVKHTFIIALSFALGTLSWHVVARNVPCTIRETCCKIIGILEFQKFTVCHTVTALPQEISAASLPLIKTICTVHQ